MDKEKCLSCERDISRLKFLLTLWQKAEVSVQLLGKRKAL